MNGATHALGSFVSHFGMARVSPPQQDIGVGESFIGDALRRFIKIGSCRFDLTVAQFVESIGDGTVEAGGVNFFGSVRRLFVPDKDAHGIGHLISPERFARSLSSTRCLCVSIK